MSPRRVIPFPAADSAAKPTEQQAMDSPSESRPTLSPQQVFVSATRRLFEEVDAECPPPGLLGLWKKRLFGGQGEAMYFALAELQLLGALNRGNGYVFTRLESGVREGIFEPHYLLTKALRPGMLSMDGISRWTGEGWEPGPLSAAAENGVPPSETFQRPAPKAIRPVPKLGDLSPNGRLRFDGANWEPVVPPGRGA